MCDGGGGGKIREALAWQWEQTQICDTQRMKISRAKEEEEEEEEVAILLVHMAARRREENADIKKNKTRTKIDETWLQ